LKHGELQVRYSLAAASRASVGCSAMRCRADSGGQPIRESCGGYIKTYNGSGNESLLLADWTSLHLDVITRDRGLHRSAASLYEAWLPIREHLTRGVQRSPRHAIQNSVKNLSDCGAKP